jgi:predicted DNA-binding transcriptional regulator AlpA
MSEHSLRRFLRKEQAKAMFGDPTDSTWYRWIATGLIPRPVKMASVRLSIALWDEGELIAAQERLLAERDQRMAERTAAVAADEDLGAVEAAVEAPPRTVRRRKARGRPRGKPRKKAEAPELATA